MRERLENLIDKYEKKRKLNVSDSMQEYYRGKIDAYEVSLKLLYDYELDLKEGGY